MERFLGCRPEVIAYDLHPDYPSTHYALDRAEPRDQRRRAASPRARRERYRRARPRRAGDRRRVRRHRLRHRRQRVGRGGARRLAGAVPALATLRRRWRSPAASAPSASPGGSAWRCCSTPTTATRPGCGTSPPSPRRRVRVRQALARGSTRPEGPRDGPAVRRHRGAGPRAGTSRYEGAGGAGLEPRRRPGARTVPVRRSRPAARCSELDLRPMVRALVEEHLLRGVPAARLSAKFHDTSPTRPPPWWAGARAHGCRPRWCSPAAASRTRGSPRVWRGARRLGSGRISTGRSRRVTAASPWDRRGGDATTRG